MKLHSGIRTKTNNKLYLYEKQIQLILWFTKHKTYYQLSHYWRI